MAKSLRPPKAPNLPIGPVVYEQAYQQQLNNANRLYYNQVDNTLGVLLQDNGGRYLNFPHIAATGNTNQYASASNTPTLVAWDLEESDGGFDLISNAAVAKYDGIYRIDYSLQFVNTDNVQHEVIVWLDLNGSAVARSGSKFTIPARKTSSIYGYTIAVSFVIFSIIAGQSITLYWQTDQAYSTTGPVDGVYMENIAAASPIPAIPAAVGSITFVSELL